MRKRKSCGTLMPQLHTSTMSRTRLVRHHVRNIGLIQCHLCPLDEHKHQQPYHKTDECRDTRAHPDHHTDFRDGGADSGYNCTESCKNERQALDPVGLDGKPACRSFTRHSKQNPALCPHSQIGLINRIIPVHVKLLC